MANQNDPTVLRDLQALPGLEKFVDRLKPGMELEGRIVHVLTNDVFILRVLGNNILAESNYPFKKFDEAILHVRAVSPKLVFHMRPSGLEQNRALYA